jgi:hypothetical protein
MPQKNMDLPTAKKPMKFGNEKKWFMNRFKEAVESDNLTKEKSVLIFKRYYCGPPITTELLDKSGRQIPKWIKEFGKPQA